MDIKNRFLLLRDLANALRLEVMHRKFEFGGAEGLKAYQEQQLRKVVRHAASHSPYYRQLCRGVDIAGNFQLRELPIVDKRLMMENFDAWVTDSSLRRADIERQIEVHPDEQFYLGKYCIVATSGSSGLRGLFVYDRPEWQMVMAASLRWASMYGTSRLELGYKKIASIKGSGPFHATSRLGQSLEMMMHRLLSLDATMPVSTLVAELNRFQPDLLMGYASLITLLAVEQTEGRLSISPSMVATFSEMLSADRFNRVQAAWNVAPFNHYGSAEQVMIAADCSAHMGLHHFADMSIVEIVDSENQPVPPGTPGQKVLLTNLHKFVQPIIRYEMSDILTQSPIPCVCGRSFPLFSSIGGRSEDTLHLPGRDGRIVEVSPMVITTSLVEMAEVVEYQYGIENGALKLRVVPMQGVDTEYLRGSIVAVLSSALSGAGGAPVQIEVEFVESIKRSSEFLGKLRTRT